MEHFEGLDLKYVQHDTLGHYFLTHAAAQGHYSRANVLHNKALKFFSATFRDTSEYLIQASCQSEGLFCTTMQGWETRFSLFSGGFTFSFFSVFLKPGKKT